MTKRENRIFGPVPSRRLGFSLGIDLVPFKTCTLDCAYCQLGSTTNKTVERREYVPPAEIIEELKSALEREGRIDWITFSGSGEPTLHSGIGGMIREIKRFSEIPVAVLTNGTLLDDRGVQEDLFAADLVVPDLDAGSAAVFARVNRPHPSLSFEKVVRGIEVFTSRFHGRVWLEVVLVKGFNDAEEELRGIAAIAARIRPERVHLNTVVRPPAEPGARPLSEREMLEAKSVMSEILTGIPIEVVAGFEGEREGALERHIESAIAAYLKRRPATLADLSASVGLHRNEVLKYLSRLLDSGKVGERIFGETNYFIFKG